MKLSYTLSWCNLIHNFYLISQGKTPTLRNVESSADEGLRV